MIKTFCIIMLFTALFLLTAGCVGEQPASPGSVAIFDNSNDGETYPVQVGSEVRLKLIENPTTGYEWNLMVPDGISITGDEFEAPTTDLMGAPGTHIWTMKVGTAGTYTIEGKYVRSWETDADPAETFTLTLIAS